ncbi:MAG: hypothetical protein Kow0013_10070 [Pararhodobacter sp.]
MRAFSGLFGTLLALAPLAAAGQEGGMSIAQPAACQFASDLGRFLTVEEIENPQGARVVQEIYPEVMQDGMIYFEVEDLTGQNDGSQWIVLQHCPSSQVMLVRQNGVADEAVRSRLWDMLAATETYTMPEAAGILTGLGATVQVTDVALGTCPCEHQQFYYGN